MKNDDLELAACWLEGSRGTMPIEEGSRLAQVLRDLKTKPPEEKFIAHSGGRTPIDEDGYVTLARGKLRAEAFKERLRCGALCDEFFRNHEHLRGTNAWYAANVIQAMIFGAK